ncbi:hypothetical protein H7K45_26030 [Mycobacterium yunnanensis]|uniref:Mce-associated membrane protein n=1 Tax=Mycobacterium yunnanensis TaxID=368477 RepID=A0A9X2YRA3_9MYCO|nr:hypothetical protein [Mycobacterium yunnanensis]MCV7424018.1 hypothetical protein [Mycobacterium yunnanensis]
MTGSKASASRIVFFGILPGLALVLALASGFLKFADANDRVTQTAGVASVQAAKEAAVALLTYQPDSVERQLSAAQDRLTGSFRDSYSSLTRDVVIPGAKQQHVSTVATVPAAASVSATENHAQVLLFVDQTATVGDAKGAPTATRSTVLVTLDKVGGRWLVSNFEPK